jgi:hypothetical protein
MIASIFTILPVASQPPLPPEGDNPVINVEDSGYTASLRVYGEDSMGPYLDQIYGDREQFVYMNYWDPFDPTALQKDVLTFNPAIVLWDGVNFAMSADSRDIHTKKYLRLWYEPVGVWTKTAYTYPAIELESTYMLIDEQNWTPTTGSALNTWFAFPFVEIAGQTGVGAFENPGSDPGRDNVVTLAGVAGQVASAYNKTTQGTIQIQKTYLMNPNETVQFLDHKLRYEYVVTRDGREFAKVTMWYAGNIEDDTKVKLLLGQYDDGSPDDPHGITWFKRHNERFSSANHANQVTWYARFEDYTPGTYKAEITVGKELEAGDTYYVNAVRYDVPAVEVIDTDGNVSDGADEFKYITIRTPLPKAGTSTLVPDDGKASSQWIDTIAPNETIPVNPPFNMNYTMIDDINVVLWEPAQNAAFWPVGNPAGTLGESYFPWAERYLTMQEEQIMNETWCWNNTRVGANWFAYFGPTPAAMKIDINNNPETPGWIAYDPSERLLSTTPLKFCYIAESIEPEFSTSLLEILNETFRVGQPPLEGWANWGIHTLPDHYTEFALPARPDVQTPYLNKTGDYLLTTSYLAPNSINKSELIDRVYRIPRVSFAFDIEYEDDVLDDVLMGDAKDIYVNLWGNDTTIRIYGEKDFGPIRGYGDNGTYAYVNYWEPFAPQSIRKDSITFNPAILPWSGEYPMSANSKDVDLKKFLRVWYEPDHVYSKPSYKRPTIEVESTYMLIDEQDKLPISGSAWQTFFAFPIAEDTTTDQPGLELFENPNSDPDRENVVTLAGVYGTVAPFNKTVYDNASIRIQKTYTLDVGDRVQFLDKSLEFVGIVVNNDTYYAKVNILYQGNDDPDPTGGVDTVLGEFGGVYKDPHQLTWFKRHQEKYEQPSHPSVTWYARLENYFPQWNRSEITVGKELMAGDVFYVDGVRYDVEAVEVLDTDNNTVADQFKYITIKTPLPKAPTKTEVLDDGIISSQWIWTIPPEMPLWLNPPFTMQHLIVDDIDVPAPFPSVEERIIGPYAPLVFFYVEEAIEPRYSTNLLEVLWENITGTAAPIESWTKFDIVTRPDQYTEFVLPADRAAYNFTTFTWDEDLHNDYLITTSFLAQNSIGVSDLVDPLWTIPRMAFRYDAIERTGKYINEIIEEPPIPWNLVPNVSAVITPPGNVSDCADVQVCSTGTTDDQWPLTVWVDWGDGTTSAAQEMVNAGTPVCFTHKYMGVGTYPITVYAKDIYGAVGSKGYSKIVEEACACLSFRPGWNAFSTPVDGAITPNALFLGQGWWDGQVWKYESGTWSSVGGATALDPTHGYFVYKTSAGTYTKCIAGSEATFSDAWMTSGQWNLLGVGFTPQTVGYWAYLWDAGTWSYIPMHNLQPGSGYFVKPL